MSITVQFNRLISPLRTKIFLLLGRGIVKALKTDEGTQLIQVVGLEGETISDIERMEEYGFTAVAQTDSEAVIGFLNGNREQGLVLCINDRRYRPKDLNSGEVCVYDKNGSKILLTENGDILITATTAITLEDKNGSQLILDGTGKAEIKSSLGLTLNSGDAGAWIVNTLPNDPFTGLPHGGSLGGVLFLKGA